MSDGIIVLLVTFIVGMIAIMAPILKLNSTITKLDTTIENFKNEYEKDHTSLKSRVDTHEVQIEELGKTAVEHNMRIKTLEGKENKNGR